VKEKIAFGVDFGTTNSIAAAWGEDVRRQGGKSISFLGTPPRAGSVRTLLRSGIHQNPK
jgi:molecular chaperone DnaK (HSP70)